MNLPLGRRPAIVAIAGPNGAGKTTFYFSHLSPTGLRFVNADVLAAARLAESLRQELVAQRESFIFETVFSDRIGAKIEFLKQASGNGYNTILCFIGISGPDVSDQRVAMRISQGGHDVPQAKLIERFPRTLANLQAAIRQLPQCLDLRQ